MLENFRCSLSLKCSYCWLEVLWQLLKKHLQQREASERQTSAPGTRVEIGKHVGLESLVKLHIKSPLAEEGESCIPQDSINLRHFYNFSLGSSCVCKKWSWVPQSMITSQLSYRCWLVQCSETGVLLQNRHYVHKKVKDFHLVLEVK